ncbi:MAG: hypothetical protein ACI80K_004877, partial [Paracoccaceae bacterium]
MVGSTLQRGNCHHLDAALAGRTCLIFERHPASTLPFRRVLAVLIPPDPAARALLYRCALLPEDQPPLT